MAKSKFVVGETKKLHSGAKWEFRAIQYTRLLFFFLIFFFFGNYSFKLSYLFLLKTFLIIFSFMILLIELYVFFLYSSWRYSFIEEGLKTEEGVIYKKFKELPYSKIQNIEIRRGIFARLFGYSTLLVQTAGTSTNYAEGHIPAMEIEEAELAKEYLKKRSKKKLI